MSLKLLKTACLFSLFLLTSSITFGTIIEIIPVQGGFSRNSTQFQNFEWNYNLLIQTLDSTDQNLSIKLGSETITYSDITSRGWCTPTIRVVRSTSTGVITEDLSVNFFSGTYNDSSLNITYSFYIGIFGDEIYGRFEGFTSGNISIFGQSIQYAEFGYVFVQPSNEPFDSYACGYEGDEEDPEFDLESSLDVCNSNYWQFPDLEYGGKILEIGVATDYDFFINHTNYLDVVLHVLTIVGWNSSQFGDYTGISVCVVAIGIREYPGPEFNGENLFHRYAYIPCANYDMCGLISGKQLDPCGATPGGKGIRCGGSLQKWDEGMFYAKQGGTIKLTSQTFYHELSHCLDIGHTPDACRNKCYSNQTAYIMCPTGCGSQKDDFLYDWLSIQLLRNRINGYPCLDEPVQQPCLDCSKTSLKITSEFDHIYPPCTPDISDVTFTLQTGCKVETFDFIYTFIPKTFFDIIDYDDVEWNYNPNSSFYHVFYKENVVLQPYSIIIHTIKIKAIKNNEGTTISFSTPYHETIKLITSNIEPSINIQGSVNLSDLLIQDPNLFNNKKFHINGQLNWDINDMVIENKTFVFDQNSGITLETGLKLTFNNTYFQGCDYLWKGIDLKLNCSFNSFGCKFEDAINAVRIAQGNGIHSFQTTVFENNYIGILCLPYPNQNQSQFHFMPDFSSNTFTSTKKLKPISEFGSHPENSAAGIIFYNATNNIILSNKGYRNKFSNLNNGILDINSNLALYGGFEFENINYDPESPFQSGNAIYSSGKGHMLNISNVGNNKTKVNNCHVGIFISNNNFSGTYIEMTNVNHCTISDRSIGKRFVLSHSILKANNHCVLLNQCHNGSGAIFSNTFDVIGIQDPNNISSAVTVLDAGSTSKWNIYNNKIVSMNSSLGIALHNVRNSNVLKNTISKTEIMPGSKFTGILLSNSSFNAVNCNNITIPSSKLYTGIFLLQSAYNKVECNNVSGRMDTHIFLEGDCNSTFLKGNNFELSTLMNNSSIVVNDYSIIGLQPFHGNQFHDSQDLWNKDNYELRIAQSQFRIGENFNEIKPFLAFSWIMTPPITDDYEIFVKFIENTLNYECPQNKENCVPLPYEKLPNDLFSKAINDQNSLLWGDFNGSMSHTYNNRLAYDVLYHKPTGYDSDSMTMHFLDSMSNTNIGTFQSLILDLDEIGKEYRDFNSTHLIKYDSLYEKMYTFFSSLDTTEITQTDIDTLLSLEDEINNLNALYQDSISDAEMDYLNFRTTYLSNYNLSGLSPQDSIFISTYIKLYASMADTSEFFHRIELYENAAISDSCYLSYGDGVFIQRGLTGINGFNWHYQRNCYIQEQQAKGINENNLMLTHNSLQKQFTVMEPDQISIYPNPASKEITVIMRDNNDIPPSIGNMNLLDINGGVILSHGITTGLKGTTIDISGIPAGMYLISISKGTSPEIKYFKLIILK